jgi:hypothetical protein
MDVINPHPPDSLTTLQKSDKEYQHIVDIGQSSFIRIIAIFGILNSTIQPAVLYFISKTSISIIDILFNFLIFFIAVSYLILLNFRKLLSFTNVYICFMGFFGIFYLAYGTQQGVFEGNIFYLTLLPLMGFFFLGKKGGVIYSSVVVLCILILSSAPGLSSFKLYTMTQIIQMVSVIFAEGFFLYFYQNIVDQTHNLIKGQADKLKEANDTNEKTIVILQDQKKQLEAQTLEIQKHEQTLIEQKNDVERLNKIMIDRELKMVELKKQIADLQKLLPPEQVS